MENQLTSAQRAIVYRPPATTSVFAAPGSGKTTVLTNHLVYQIGKVGLHPKEIMAVTFTKQAAKEMKRRIAVKLQGQPRQQIEGLRLGTFHAQIFSMLLAEIPDIPVLFDPREQFQTVKTALQLQCLPDSVEDVRQWLTYLSRIRAKWPVQEKMSRRAKRFLMQYDGLKRRNHRWDFDDILVEACRRIEWGETKTFRLNIKYLLMDEFQDTNEIQWQIVRYLVSLVGAKLFVVGDDDQCIYGFRGANPDCLIHFNKWFPEARLQHLDTNFRSDSDIVAASCRLIQHNKQRYPKNIDGFSSRTGLTGFMKAATELEEGQNVLRLVRGENPHQTIAVLARTRRQIQTTWSCFPPELRKQVEFRTFHDAKGKEWDIVHIVGAVETNPYLHENQKGQTVDKEEERRAFYVAMTRARHKLYVHSPGRIAQRKSSPVRFIEESGLMTGEHAQTKLFQRQF